MEGKKLPKEQLQRGFFACFFGFTWKVCDRASQRYSALKPEKNRRKNRNS